MTTYLHAVSSLDGYIADDNDDVGSLHDWYFNGDRPVVDEDHPEVVIQGERVLHLRYPVRKN